MNNRERKDMEELNKIMKPKVSNKPLLDGMNVLEWIIYISANMATLGLLYALQLVIFRALWKNEKMKYKKEEFKVLKKPDSMDDLIH